ncbi:MULTISPECIES: TetR/AcrR family transcriptional regulator [unclassified Rhizobium]|uniref:TetR/AcrR family transcriptional regulator n=1 Tax=unclassified Rhizobium TaxID=2613769 RepID=UPI002A4E22CE|nr:TetR/AcrR family transcriptional regulator [Rhizobium sp. Root274]
MSMIDRTSVVRLALRKLPQQERSVQRLEAILDSAMALVLEKDVSTVTMSEIAQRAGIPIGSLYQFFPQKAAVLKALHDRLSMEIEDRVSQIFSGVSSLEEAAKRGADALFELHTLFRERPIFMSIWQAIQSDKDLNHLSNDYHEHLMGVFLKDLAHLIPAEELGKVRITLKLFIITSGDVIRFATSQGPDAARVYLDRWHQIVRNSLFVS